MSERAEIVVQEPPPAAIMPAMSIAQAVDRYGAMTEFVSKILHEGVDFGTIPGTGTKPTLLKPGAEKLTTFFGLSVRFVVAEKVLDWTGADHESEPFFNYEYKCQLYRQDQLVGEGIGSCNSWEKKYRYRTASLTCPNCKQPSVIKGLDKYGGGWICWAKKGGCGSKWDDGDAAIEKQERGIIRNENPADLVNTISKMAQKRALVGATLITVNASEFFTQDIEDMDVGSDSPRKPQPASAPAQRPPAQRARQPQARQAPQPMPEHPPSPPWEGEIVDANSKSAPEPVAEAKPTPAPPISASSDPPNSNEAHKFRKELVAAAESYAREFAHGVNADKATAKATQRQGNLIASQFTNAFAPAANAAEAYRSTLQFLFGVDSAYSLSFCQARAVLGWLTSGKDSGGEYVLNAGVEHQARLCLTEAVLDARQTELDMAGEEE